MRLTRGDKVLIVFLSIFSLVFAGFMWKKKTSINDSYISIQIDGEEVKTIEFSDDLIGKTYVIKSKFGRNVLEFGDRSVRVIEADCPDKLDIKQGVIDKPGEMLICLPNRMIVEIKERDDSEKEVIDQFNY